MRLPAVCSESAQLNHPQIILTLTPYLNFTPLPSIPLLLLFLCWDSCWDFSPWYPLCRPPPIIDILSIQTFITSFQDEINEFNKHELFLRNFYFYTYYMWWCLAPLCFPKLQIWWMRGRLWVILCCFPLGHNQIICTCAHTKTSCTHTHTSASKPPAQMLISTAVFLCVWASFTMMLQHVNQTLLQCETWGAHTDTLIQACTQAQMFSTYIHLLWTYVCVPNCLHQHL